MSTVSAATLSTADTFVSAEIGLPDACIGCGAAWEEDCTRCGLARADAAALLAQACADFAQARTHAQAGRFADALRYLEAARAGGLALHPAVRRLGELCAVVMGKNASEAARNDYALARAAAQKGELFEAAIRAEQATLAVPLLLPAQKLHVLCLAAMCRGEEAERLRRALLRDLPGEPDLLRWNFTPLSPRRRRVTAPALRRVARLPAPVSVQPPPRREWAVVGGAAFGFAALVVSTVSALRPASPVVLTVPTPAPSAIAPVLPAEKPRATSATLPPDLQRDYDEKQKTQAEQQARQWMNEATSAFRRKEWARAERLASAAHQIGPKTYLAEDALLLEAQSADNQNKTRSLAQYERLADLRPQSPYAPVALGLAIRAAQRFGQMEQAQRLRVRLQTQYPGSVQAARLKV